MTSTCQRQLRLSTLPAWMIAASFGPYVFAGYGIRLEHLLIYSLLPFALLALFAGRWTVISFPPLFACLASLLFITVWTALVTLCGSPDYAMVYELLARIEDYAQPIAIILVICAFVRPASETAAGRILEAACRVLILMLLLNALIAVASVFLDLSSSLRYFVADPDREGLSVAARAATMGRFSGIYNQPFECGLTYSVGLFAWAYLILKSNRISLADYVRLICLLLGGCLSVSKAFILVGCPLFFLYCLSESRIRCLLNWRWIAFGVASVALGFGLLDHWTGRDSFLALFDARSDRTPNLVWRYTAGRFGSEDTEVVRFFTRVWEEAPIQGAGFMVQGALDNAYLAFFVQGGLIALTGYLILLLSIGLTALRQRVRRRDEGRFLRIIIFYIVAAGMGAPVITINRFSTVFWVLLMLIYLTISRRPPVRSPALRSRK
jgi:hypothetical protein